MNFQEFLQTKIIHLGSYSLTVERLLMVLVTYIGTYLFLAILLRWFRRITQLRSLDQGRAHSISLLIKYFIWTGSIALMLSFLGIQAGVLIASSAALFVGLGLGVQSIFKDYVSGIFILFDGTIEVGDVLEVSDIVGVVEQINLRATIVTNRDGVAVIVPNSKVLSENVINWTHNRSITRFRIPIRVMYQTDPDTMTQVLLKVAHQVSGVEDPQVRISDFGEHSVLYELEFWCKSAMDIEETKSKLRLLMLRECKEQGIKLDA